MPFRSISENTRHYVTQHMPGRMRANGIEATLELARALSWLRDYVPVVTDPPVPVYLDFGLNNMLIEEDQVIGILD